MKNPIKKLTSLSAAFLLASTLTACADQDNTYSCTGAKGEKVNVTWQNYSATAEITYPNGSIEEASSVNRFHLAKAYIRPLGGTCANWHP